MRISFEQQTENHYELKQLNIKMRAFRHDMRNHMLSLSSLLPNKGVDQAKQYIENSNDSFIGCPPITNTENYVFAAFLAEKKKATEGVGITMDCEIQLSRKLDIDNLDWSIMFGNILDNAIEATIISGEEKASVQFQIFLRGNGMRVICSNSRSRLPMCNYNTNRNHTIKA